VGQACEVTKGGHVVQGFFHRWVAELEPLLHEVDTQQGLHCKRLLAPPSTLRCVGLYQRDQFCPGHHQFHGIEKFALAGALGGVAQAQAALLHALIVWPSGLLKHIAQGFVQSILSGKNPFENLYYRCLHCRRCRSAAGGADLQ
jgi:hypothetical protein